MNSIALHCVTTLRSTCSPAGGGVLPGERGRSHTPVTCSSLNYGEDKTLDSNTPLHFVQGIDSLWRSHFFCEPLFVYSPYQPFLLPILDFDFSPLILNPRLHYIKLFVFLKTNKILQVVISVYVYFIYGRNELAVTIASCFLCLFNVSHRWLCTQDMFDNACLFNVSNVIKYSPHCLCIGLFVID